MQAKQGTVGAWDYSNCTNPDMARLLDELTAEGWSVRPEVRRGVSLRTGRLRHIEVSKNLF